MTESHSLKENEDYVLVPIEEHPDAWAVRFTSGQFVETTIMYGAIGFNEVKDSLTFNFDVYSSPDSELTPDDEELQEQAAAVLEAIIIKGIDEGYVQLKDKDE